jgi:hypothetical protein
MVIAWSIVSWAQAFMTNRTSFYITRALIGAFEGGFIPGTILFTTYFYTSRELSVRLAFFWSTLNVSFLYLGLDVYLTNRHLGPGGSRDLVPSGGRNSTNAWSTRQTRLVLSLPDRGSLDTGYRSDRKSE